jgi:AraC-like DNA-binding protein
MTPSQALTLHARRIDTGPLDGLVTHLVAIGGLACSRQVLLALPSDTPMLHVHLNGDPERDRAGGQASLYTGIRRASSPHAIEGDFLTLFALLTPAGSLALLHGQTLAEREPCLPLQDLLDTRCATSLERGVHAAYGEHALQPLGRWLEQRLTRRLPVPASARRAAAAAIDLGREPRLSVSDAAARQAVSSRQLERDMLRCFNVGPKHYAMAARLQAACRLASQGLGLSAAAAEAGYADQAHLSRETRKLTGLTARQVLGAGREPVTAAFRRAVHGATLFA